jgi:hypothetical protein
LRSSSLVVNFPALRVAQAHDDNESSEGQFRIRVAFY